MGHIQLSLMSTRSHIGLVDFHAILMLYPSWHLSSNGKQSEHHHKSINNPRLLGKHKYKNIINLRLVKHHHEQKYQQTALGRAYNDKFIETTRKIHKPFQCGCSVEYTSNDQHYQNHINNCDYANARFCMATQLHIITHAIWKRGIILVVVGTIPTKNEKFHFLALQTLLEKWQRLMCFVSQTNNLACFDSGSNHSANHFQKQKTNLCL